MKDLSGLSDSFTKMTMLDDDRRKEVLVIDKIALAQLNSDSVPITGGPPSTGGTLYPVTNMNFTDNADGWIFSADLYNPETPPTSPVTLANNVDEDNDGSTNDDKKLDPPNNNGLLPDGGFSGGWGSEAIPSESGPGSLFTYFSFIREDNAKQGGALMKWTYKFSLDTTTASAINDATFSIGYYIPKLPDPLKVKGPAEQDKAVIFYTITTPSATYPIEIDEQNDEISWNSKQIPSSRIKDSNNNPISWTSGDYKLQITVMVDLEGKKSTDKAVSEIMILFDDVGIKLNLKSSGQSITVNSYGLSPPKFSVSSSETISSLDFSIQASSSLSAKQYVFLYDFARSEWALSLSSSISSSTSNVKLTKQSLDVPRFVAQVAGSYTVDGSSKTAAVGDVWVRIVVSAVTASPTLTYSATLSLDTQIIQDNKVSFVVSNTGGITAHIVRYWIVTGAETKAVDADTYVDPGKSVTISEDISPTTGAVEIRIITERGTIASFTETV